MSNVGLESDFLGVFGLCERDGAILLAQNQRILQHDAAPERVYDLPGGRVEAGETLLEALAREWREECSVEIETGPFLFVQEGVRRVRGQRRYAWRSFFFRVTCDAEPRPASEVAALAWVPASRLPELLRAPYHDGFLRWLDDEQPFQRGTWD